ncbi:uncharacterized protein V6R79_001563 [Siganus canaliculatus]
MLFSPSLSVIICSEFSLIQNKTSLQAARRFLPAPLHQSQRPGQVWTPLIQDQPAPPSITCAGTRLIPEQLRPRPNQLFQSANATNPSLARHGGRKSAPAAPLSRQRGRFDSFTEATNQVLMHSGTARKGEFTTDEC